MMRAATGASSRWRASAQARSLVGWRDAQLRALAEAVDQTLTEWGAAWGVSTEARVECATQGIQLEPLAWQPLHLGGQLAGWLHMPQAGAARLGMRLFPGADPGAGSVAATVAAECGQDALRRLLSIFGMVVSNDAHEVPGAADMQPWSGVVQVQLPAPLQWQLLLQPVTLRAWCETRPDLQATRSPPPPTPLVPVISAIAALPTRVSVALAGCELDLATLQRLRPGDVLRMQHRIDAPATLTDRTGTPLFGAYLGRRAGARAVELAPLRPSVPSPDTPQDLP